MNSDTEQNGKSSSNFKGCFCSTKTKVALVSLLALTAVLTVAAVCAAVFSSRANTSSPTTGAAGNSLETMPDELVTTPGSEHATIQRRQTRSPVSCYSLQTNDSLPAAHITGTKRQWRDSSDGIFYDTQWVCNKTGAFVDGGMYFNQTDKKLYVPKCGYYYVSSQIYFSYTPEDQQKFVRHLLKVERNCGEGSTLDLESLSALGEVGRQAQTTTYVADTVKICSGGKISVAIPKMEKFYPCCPGGQNTITYFSAHLVKETSCEWSNRHILASPPTQD